MDKPHMSHPIMEAWEVMDLPALAMMYWVMIMLTRYTESYNPAIPADLIYSGSKKLTDMIDIDGVGALPVGKLILSPTRTYIPVIKDVLAAHRNQISGMIHCTGGAQSKVLKFY